MKKINNIGKSISAFTLIKNMVKFDYPCIESINSVLPFVDEVIVNIGKSDDGTEELLQKEFGQEEKVILFEQEWEDSSQGTTFFSNQTNNALGMCSSDWALYIQADEVLHEDDGVLLGKWIDRADRENAHGILFNYNHFAKDPWHVKKTYKDGFDFYDKEIRLFRNDNSMISFGDGQSFCFIEDFMDPRGPQPAMHRASRFIESPLQMYHYSYLRDKKKLLEKKKYLETFYKVSEPGRIENIPQENGEYVIDDSTLKEFTGQHPAVMAKRINDMKNKRV